MCTYVGFSSISMDWEVQGVVVTTYLGSNWRGWRFILTGVLRDMCPYTMFSGVTDRVPRLRGTSLATLLLKRSNFWVALYIRLMSRRTFITSTLYFPYSNSYNIKVTRRPSTWIFYYYSFFGLVLSSLKKTTMKDKNKEFSKRKTPKKTDVRFIYNRIGGTR